MNSPKVSVVIPTYNGKDYLSEAIQSILDQTYSNFEIIVVDDASPDNTAEVMSKFEDPRIKYLVHETNRGVREARKTGISSLSGEVIAFLDQDDMFHPQKLESHVEYLMNHPDIGMTYNARFSFNTSPAQIRNIWRPPAVIGLPDVVLGFPIAPSDMVFRREWAIQTKYFEGNWGNSGGEIVRLGRMLFDGCRLGLVDKALNYRRFHPRRVFKNLLATSESELRCREIIFSDPRCPEEVRDLRNQAYVKSYMFFGSRAFIQRETSLGQDFYRKAFQLDPSILYGAPSTLMNYLVDFVIEDETQDHEELLKLIISQLPVEMASLSGELTWAVASGYLVSGAQDIMWNRTDAGLEKIRKAREAGIRMDQPTVQRLSSLLLDFDIEFGYDSARKVLREWVHHLKNSDKPANTRLLVGDYYLNRAFRSFQLGNYDGVPGMVFRSIVQNPSHLTNRGVQSIFLRSIFKVAR